MQESDQTIANLVTDGCNMGITSINRYLNQYGEADDYAKNIAKELIKSEENLVKNVRKYL